MSFDWFRRSTSPEGEDESQASGKPTPEVPEEAPSPQTEEFDYLAFAKAAYANLKSKETAAQPEASEAISPPIPGPVSSGSVAAPSPELTTAPTVTPPPLPMEEPVAPPSSPEDVAQLAASTSVEDESTPPPIETALGSDIEASSQALAAEDSTTQNPAIEPTPAKAFFEMAPKATERLEALEATAIEAPVPPPPPSPTQPSPTQTSVPIGVDAFPTFDEGFRWSAEVLAAQGRRPDQVTVEEISWLQKMQRGLGKTRLSLINQLKSLVGKGPLNDDAVEEIEAVLLQADVGIAATDQIVAALQKRMREEVLPPDAAVAYLKQLLRELLSVGEPTFAPEKDTLNIWLMVGVNGSGKTTTLGKIAHLAQKSGYRSLLAAGDTFRAAAVEQLKVWGERTGVEVIANPGQNVDPAAVVYDAIAAAQSRQVELLLVDTAGRLQNKKNLMDELAKIRRIVDKKAPEAKVESLLVLDATLGQNGMRQAQVFSEAANLSGVVLTKLDGTAKGGVALAVAKEMQLPIRFIGVGEGLEDLRPFSSYEFVEALVSEY
jgi:fused signal recognition particle receptor